MSADDLDDRPLPGRVFAAMLNGQLTADQALAAAREQHRREDARGGDMNDRMWEALGRNAPDQRAQRAQSARDEHGRFARTEESAPQAATMNDLIRQQLAAGAAGLAAGGTVDLDLGHLSRGPSDKAA